MIRRWSFIGFANNSLYSSYIPLTHYLVDVNVNSVMYLRKVHSFFTRTRRRPWARRKHLYNWLIGSSILKFWAKCYRTHRNTHKFLQNVFAMKTSFLTFGVYFKRSKLLQILQQSSELVLSCTTKLLFRRNIACAVWSKLSFLSYSVVKPLFISSNSTYFSSSTTAALQSLGFFSFVADNALTLSPNSSSTSSQLLCILFFNQFFELWLSNLKFLYRSSILLLLLCLN